MFVSSHAYIDQVVNYEVVLADGSIVEANATTNSDLFRVLKGGSNNFGIVSGLNPPFTSGAIVTRSNLS